MVIIKWLGHSVFEVSNSKLTIFIDPFISDNPKAPLKVLDIRKADYVLVTHDHFDHMSDAIAICNNTGASMVAVPEVIATLPKAEVGKAIKTVAPNLGSTINLGELKVAMVPAFHTSSVGAPVGFVFSLDGETIYHAGDTSLFGDMRLIGEIYKPDIALLPIGGYYTMGPKEAAIAASLINPKVVIPMHYGTFAVLEQNPDNFIEETKKTAKKVKVHTLKPGETYSAK